GRHSGSDWRDVDSRSGSLLRIERRGDRGNRGAVLAGRDADRGRGLRPTSGRGLPRPRKRYGQHFLEAAWVGKLIEALRAESTDVFLEIGPGRGALTIPLAGRVARVIAIEIDRDLAAALPARIGPNVRVIQG